LTQVPLHAVFLVSSQARKAYERQGGVPHPHYDHLVDLDFFPRSGQGPLWVRAQIAPSSVSWMYCVLSTLSSFGLESVRQGKFEVAFHLVFLAFSPARKAYERQVDVQHAHYDHLVDLHFVKAG